MPPFVLSLSDPSATLEAVGGKGISLAKLVPAGLPAPDGFHITAVAYREFVAANGLQPHILKMLEPVDAAISITLETASQAIGRLFALHPSPRRSGAPSAPVTRHSAPIPRYHPRREHLLPCVPLPLPRTCQGSPLPDSRRPTSTSRAQRPSWKPSENAGHR